MRGEQTLNGSECFKKLLVIDPEVRVLKSTGHGGPAETEDMLGNCAVGVLLKPFAVEEFYISVATALLGSR